MESRFSAKEYVKTLAQELVESFDKAGRATTPGLVGSAREKAVRRKLEEIFPQAIGVGTGCVIDVHNKTSKQTDIIIYEKDICPVFAINDNPESSYYPCESVIAVGEVKSTLGTAELLDAFAKIESVKSLWRAAWSTQMYRKYCSRTPVILSKKEHYDQQKNPLDQIFGFIICETIGLARKTFMEKCVEEIQKRPSYLVPNMIVSLHDGVLVHGDSVKHVSCTDSAGADSIYFVDKKDRNFQQLLAFIHEIIAQGRTVSQLPFIDYVIGDTNYPDGGSQYVYKKKEE